MAPVLESFQPIFGEAKAECDSLLSLPLHPFLFYIYAMDLLRLRVVVSDFRSHTFDSVLTIQDLEDLRDRSGIGGVWSEFVGYLVASMSSDNVKLVLQSLPNSVDAKLLARKSKGMPLISVSLGKLVEASAGDAMAGFSLQLFKAYKDEKSQYVSEQENSYLLSKRLAAEKEKVASLHHQVDSLRFSSKRKQLSSNASDKGFIDFLEGLDIVPGSDRPQSSVAEKTSMQHDFKSIKVQKPVVSAHRRAKVRGAMLQDPEDKDA